MHISRKLLLALPALLIPLSAAAVPWPGAAPCNGTLQACIDATPDGNTVSIETDTPVAESINLYNRSIALVGGNGRRAALASGFWISVSSAPILGNQSVTLRGLRLTNAYVSASYLGVGTATYDFSGLELRQTNTAPTYIRVEGRSGNTVQARLYDNRVSAVPANLNAGLIELASNGGTLNAQAYYNQVSSSAETPVSGAGIFVDVTGGGGGTLKLHGNTVRGGFYRAGLFVSEGLFSSTASSFDARLYNNVVVCSATPGSGSSNGSGISLTVSNGSINGQAINNTLSRCGYGILANQWSGGGAGAAVSGLVKNNLIVGERGLTFTPAITASLSNDYNLLNVSSNTATLGSNTRTADARLVSAAQPRLRGDSPAIDAADTPTLALGLIINALPTNDADGLRRLKGAASADVDIGAYEYGDRGLLHVAGSGNTLSGYITRIDNPLLDGQSAANPVATPNWNGSGAAVPNDSALGIYYFGGNWLLFNQDRVTPMPAGAAFNVFSPAAGSGSFRHVSAAANTTGFSTRLDNSALNNLPERIVLVTQNWSAGAGVYNAHPIGLSYSADRWHIVNIDQASGGTMPLDAGFNVYAQEASPNAFRVTASGASFIELDHPLLNGIACAQVQVTRLHNGNSVARNFDVYYASGNARWRIFSYSPLQLGMQFNVLVDPAQVSDCTDRIFASDME
jgi:hypothetical protein